MFITGRSLPRRTLLRGLGAMLGLPLLDAMVPALTAGARNAAKPVSRFGVVYVPNGVIMDRWTPEAVGREFEFTRILKTLEPYRDQIAVLTGLQNVPGGGVHAGRSTGFLTGVTSGDGAMLADGEEILLKAGVSADQILARQAGHDTQLASLELALESRDVSGSCDNGYSCVYTNTISWRGDNTPLPMENNPRVVFERLFGDSGSTDPQVRLSRIQRQRSILDFVSDRVATLQVTLGPTDRLRLSEYLDAVRDVERRIQLAEALSDRDLPLTIDQPPGIPATYADHAALMFDLQLLTHQSDLTRVTTFMMGRELSGRTYPEIGVPDSHHPVSHHQNDPEMIEKNVKINSFHVSLFSDYVEQLRGTPDGDGSLLDHMVLLYGGGMGDGNRHEPANLPILLLGGEGVLKRGRHIRYADTPLSNLLVTLLDALNVPLKQIGNSSGRLDDILSAT